MLPMSHSLDLGTTAMLSALGASGPHPDLADKLELFGQFVGSWDLDRTSYAPDGTTATVPGEWHFGWVLEGRAVQDVWICPARRYRTAPIAPPAEWGTVIRFFDTSIDAWRATWVGPATGISHAFVAHEEGGEIVLRGTTDEGGPLRWVFSDITGDSFRWRSEVADDPGRAWRLTVEMRVRRRSPA
jgi:hypothetical protein